MKRRGLPIAILSFDRASYLNEVLVSLAAQLGPDDQCYLFQDGCWNPHSGTRYGTEAKITECAAIFARLIPSGRAFVSPVNLGIAGNYRRAEEFLFSALKVREALFLEDDLVLSPHYLDVTADLLDIAATQSNIGYVSAYGDFWASVETQQTYEGELQLMHENWGGALTRGSWLRQRPVREVYWSLVKGSDYRTREWQRVAQFYSDLGYNMGRISSQDASRWVACAEQGLLRITTRTCHARYIGEVGVHYTPEFYNKHRFADAVWFPRRPRIMPPTDEQVSSWLSEQRKSMAAGYVHSYVNA